MIPQLEIHQKHKIMPIMQLEDIPITRTIEFFSEENCKQFAKPKPQNKKFLSNMLNSLRKSVTGKQQLHHISIAANVNALYASSSLVSKLGHFLD